MKAYEHFNDPEWDGEPADPPDPITNPGGDGVGDPKGEYDPDGSSGDDSDGDDEQKPKRPKKLKIKLADGKERQIQSIMSTTFWSPDGKPMSAAEFIEHLFGDLPELFKNEDELRELWGQPETRRALLTGLGEKGYGDEQLAEIRRMIDADKSDIFDVLAYVAFALAPITREERVTSHKEDVYGSYTDKQREFLDFVLDQYVRQGVQELDDKKLAPLLKLKYGGVSDAKAVLGDIPQIREVFVGFQRHLYSALKKGHAA